MSKFPKLPDPAPQPEPPAPKPTKEQIFVKPEAPAPEVKAPAPPPAEKKVTFQEPAEAKVEAPAAPVEAPPKKKKQVSQKQLEHLQRMREKANAKRLEKLAEKMPASSQVNTNTAGQTHTVRQTQQPQPTQGIPTSSIPQQNIPIHNIQQSLPGMAQTPPPPPQYVYSQPDMSNFIKRTEVEGIVKNALAQQHQVMLNRAAKIREEQRVKQEKEAKEQKQKNTVHNLMYPNVRRNKWY